MDKPAFLSPKQIALYGMLGAMTFGLKLAMSPLPNIEPVSLLVMLFAVVLGLKALFPVGLYVLLEMLVYGIGLWNINYLYIWPLLALLAFLLRRLEHPLAWAMLSGIFGLAFGLLCAPVDVAVGGVHYAITKWGAGIPFDLLHCAGNFVIALLLFVPLRRLLTGLCLRIGIR